MSFSKEIENLITTTFIVVLLSSFFIIFFSLSVFSQGGIKSWAGHSYSVDFNKHWRLRAGQLYFFNEQMDFTSVQNNARIEYRFKRNFSLGVGYTHSSDPADPDQPAKHRIEPRARHRVKMGKLRVTNQLRAEWHFPSRSKYEYRLRYSMRLHAGDFGLPLGLSPYMTHELHYYLNGRPLNYRDGKGDIIVRQSPNGLHAHRIRMGVRFKVFRRANMSLSFMRQTEFNIGSEFRRINVTDPRDGDILRDFSNFSVLSFNFSYRIKT